MKIAGSRRWFGRAFGAALVAALAASALAPAPGEASSRFVYEVCDSALPGGGVPASKLVDNPDGQLVGSQNCAAPGGAFAIAEPGPAASTYAYWSVPIAATPGGYVESLTTAGGVCGLGPGNMVAFVYAQGWPVTCSDSVRIDHVHDAPATYFPGTSVTVFLNCDGRYAPGCGGGARVYGHYFAATEVDPKAPTLAGVEGSLLAGGTLRGHQQLAAAAGDVGGGLTDLSLLVNGLPAAEPVRGTCSLYRVSNPSAYGMVAASPTPCPAQLEAEWTVDTGAYPFHDGANSVSVCASDYASIGNPNTTCSPPQAVSVDNSCAEAGVAGGEELSAGFDASGSEEIVLGYGRATEVSGRLADRAGDPVSGATICVKAATLGAGAALAPVGVTKTDAGGHFAYEVPAGPNRELLLGYRHDSAQIGRSVRVYSRVRPSLRVHPRRLRNGHRIRLTGHLPDPAAGGRVVVLQASAPGSQRWITFRRASTGARGHFRSGYRFTSTTRTTRYRFRALVPSQDDYPWLEGHSKAVRVLVRGGQR